MANSKFEYVRSYEEATESRLPRDSYIVVRIDGQNFHQFTQDHKFDKPNDKRALDLMVNCAKHVMTEFKSHIPLSYGHSDEFSFLIKSGSSLFQRRTCKLTSLIVSAFTAYYVYKWDEIFKNAQQLSASTDSLPYQLTPLQYSPSFDSRAIVYSRRRVVKDYFCWRYVDCHINNLYNTTLHAMSGQYVRHKFVPIDTKSYSDSAKLYDNGDGNANRYQLTRTSIQDWIEDKSLFMSTVAATKKLTGSVKSDKHDIMMLQYKINYNNEIEQFKKGTFVINIPNHLDKDAVNLVHVSDDPTKSEFWDKYSHVFDD